MGYRVPQEYFERAIPYQVKRSVWQRPHGQWYAQCPILFLSASSESRADAEGCLKIMIEQMGRLMLRHLVN